MVSGFLQTQVCVECFWLGVLRLHWSSRVWGEAGWLGARGCNSRVVALGCLQTRVLLVRFAGIFQLAEHPWRCRLSSASFHFVICTMFWGTCGYRPPPWAPCSRQLALTVLVLWLPGSGRCKRRLASCWEGGGRLLGLPCSQWALFISDFPSLFLHGRRLVRRGIADAAVGWVPRGLLLLHGVCALGLPETPELGQRDSGERTDLLLGMWLVVGLKLRALLPCQSSL